MIHLGKLICHDYVKLMIEKEKINRQSQRATLGKECVCDALNKMVS